MRVLPLSLWLGAAAFVLSACDASQVLSISDTIKIDATVYHADGRAGAALPVRFERSVRGPSDTTANKRSRMLRTDARGRIRVTTQGGFLTTVRLYLHVRPAPGAAEQTFGPLNGWACPEDSDAGPCTLDLSIRLAP